MRRPRRRERGAVTDWKQRELLAVATETSELARTQTSEALRVAGGEQQEEDDEQLGKVCPTTTATLAGRVAGLWRTQSAVQACVVVLDFAGCVFSTLAVHGEQGADPGRALVRHLLVGTVASCASCAQVGRLARAMVLHRARHLWPGLQRAR
jgi:hypothetical protein